MTATRTISTALRASVIAGLIGAATLGVCGTAAAQPVTVVPAAYASLHTGHVVGDLDDDGGYDGGGYDGGSDAGYGGGADVADTQPAEEPAAEPAQPQELESQPQQEAPQEAEQQDAPADEQPAPEQPDMAEPSDEPAEAPAEDTAPDQAPEPTTPDAPAPDAPAPDTAPDEAPAPADTAPDTAPPADAPPAVDPAPATAPAPSPQDVDTAQRATPVEAQPAPASAATVDQLRTEITTAMTSTTSVTSTTWNREVTQWNSSWVSYDAFYRPVLLNPYRSALQLVYTYDNATRIVTVDPLSSVVVDMPTVGVYGFTPLTRSASGALTNVTVGSFTGGGYVPTKGQQRPTKPQSPPTKDNVLVRIAYANGISRPFRVKHLADLGDDAAVHARRVLIDGATSAWGRWTTAPGGEKEFDITMTLQLPGLTGPKQGPLPGYGAVQLAAAPRRAR